MSIKSRDLIEKCTIYSQSEKKIKMKKVYLVLALSFSLVLMSHENGPAEEVNKDRSGSPDGDNVCSQCHSSNSFSPMIDLVVMNSEGEHVNSYIPGETYLLEYSVVGTSGNPLAFGFQSTALTDENANSGTFTNPGVQAQLETVTNSNVTNRSVVEHSSPTSSGIWEVEWIAPSTFNGNVTFYYSGVAVNGNSMSSGDGYDGGTTVITPDFDSSVIEVGEENNIELRISQVGVEIYSNNDSNIDEVEVYSVSGRLISQKLTSSATLRLSESDLVSGINIIVCRSGKYTRTFKTFN